MKKKDLTGKEFGKLKIVKEAPRPPNVKNGTYWECICSCGGIKIARKDSLEKGTTKSCGCIGTIFPLNELTIGTTFNDLTLISYKDGKWLCKCICGKYIETISQRLKNGNTKSCGCRKTDKQSKEKIEKRVESKRFLEPRITSAKNIWRTAYLHKDKKNGFTKEQIISFEDFLIKTQESCFYCGAVPLKTTNIFEYKLRKGVGTTEKSVKEGNFTYNGLDRVDNSKNHSLENIVPCCFICNKAKNNRTLEEFINWVKELKININTTYNIITRELPKYYKTSVRGVWRRRYADGDLKVEEFECLSQYDCHYCSKSAHDNSNRANEVERNKRNSIKNFEVAEFKYNGLDRIDSNLKHDKANLVPSCKWCNIAKSDLSINDFFDWIRRIKKFQGFDIE